MTNEEIKKFLNDRKLECDFYNYGKCVSIYFEEEYYDEDERKEIMIRKENFEFCFFDGYLTAEEMQTLIDLQSKYFNERE